jgi:hypothetical protein
LPVERPQPRLTPVPIYAKRTKVPARFTVRTSLWVAHPDSPGGSATCFGNSVKPAVRPVIVSKIAIKHLIIARPIAAREAPVNKAMDQRAVGAPQRGQISLPDKDDGDDLSLP